MVWPWLLYCEMLGDISSYRATLQSEGTTSLHTSLHFTFNVRHKNDAEGYNHFLAHSYSVRLLIVIVIKFKR